MFTSRIDSRTFTKGFGIYKLYKELPNTLNFKLVGERLYLTEAYRCKDVWSQRLKNHLVSKINLDDLFIDISKKFTAKKKVSSVDVDLFACSIKNEDHFEELENVLHQFRRSKQTVQTLDSTHYAVVDLCLNFGKYDLLLKILNDRLNYGIFPSSFSYNLLLDEFLKQKNYRDAVKIAILMMLQEDFSNPISKRLALHSCYSYLKEPQPWNPVQEVVVKVENNENEGDEEEDDVYVRVPFLRNPYFDDHFDLTEPSHLIGKTLYLAGLEFDNILGRSSQLIGLGLYQKWEKSVNLLDTFLQSKDKPILLEEAIQKFTEALNNSEANDDIKSTLKNKLEKFTKNGLTSQDSLEEKVLVQLKGIPNYEMEDIEIQKKLFLEWEEIREKALERDMDEMRRKQRVAFIKEKKKELLEKEQRLFFFENWNKHEMDLAEIKEEERNKPVDSHEVEEYIPPEIVKNRSK